MAVYSAVKPVWSLCSLSTDSTGQLNVFGHNSDSLGVNGAQVRIFKKTNQISFTRFLKSHHSRTLEAYIGLDILSDFTHKAQEGQPADHQLGGFLVTTDLTKSDCSRPVTMRFLHSTKSLACRLLCSSHRY